MSVYDNVIIHDSIQDYVSDDIFTSSDNLYIIWKTKDLNPSMDIYGIFPPSMIRERYTSDKPLYLFRRHPPVVKWTTENHGYLQDQAFSKICDNADHWRMIQYSGNIRIYTSTSDMIHEYSITLSNSRLTAISHEKSEDI